MRNSAGKPTGTYSGRANKIGGGGWTHHLVQDSTGDYLYATHDTLGASRRYRTDTEWTPLITNDSLPAGFFGTGVPATSDGRNSGKGDNARGCWGIDVAKSDGTRVYTALDGRVLKSDNRGTTWTQTALAAKTMWPNTAEFRQWNNKIAVHPTDKNIVVVGSMEGSNYSTDGGTTWNAISVAAGSLINTLQSPHTFVFKQDGSKVYCHRYGTGIYEATTLAGPWTLLNATNYPTSATHMVTDATGNLWICNILGTAGANIHKWNGTTWTIYTIGGSEQFQSIAIDPANNNRITVVGLYGNLSTSTDGGATWVGGGLIWNKLTPNPEGVRLIANQVTWLGKTTWDFVPTTILYRVGATNEVWMAQGIGVVRSNPPSTFVRWDWYDESAGIEQMVTSSVLTRPNRTGVIAGFHDKAVIVSSNPDLYPTSYGPKTPDYKLQDCWWLDYAKDNESYVVCATADHSNLVVFTPFISTDGGVNWTQTPAHPDGGFDYGGTIACNRQGQVIWFPRGTSTNRPVRLAADGLSWIVMTFPGVTSTYLENQAFYINHHCVTADKENSGHFYAILSTDPTYDLGLFKTTDGGATWTQKIAGQINTGYTDYWSIQLSCVPGQSGHCYYTSGRDFTGPFTRTTDGWTSKSTVPNVDSVVCFGFGKSAPGQTYPAIYFVGRVSGVNGYYVTFDNFATAPIFIGTWPGNWVDIPLSITGDWNVFGRFYVGMAGSSVRICDYGKQAKF